MNVFGIGGMELVLILVLMLVVAGPKRMLQWAYILGVYTAKLRRMWEETAAYLQKEFDEAGLDVKVPKDLPTRQSLNSAVRREVNKAMAPVTKPVEETLGEVSKTASLLNGRKTAETAPRPPAEPPPSDAPKPDFGTWSGTNEPQEKGGAL